MRVLVVGNGGREAALALKLAQSTAVTEVLVTPMLPGCELLSPKIRTTHVAPEALALERPWELCIVGSENDLVNGLAQRLRQLGIPTIGPDPLPAQLETSKSFAKEVMRAAQIPTAAFQSFTELAAAKAHVAGPCVVKVDGPASGKGVVVCESLAGAHATLEAFFDGSWLGVPVEKVLIEEKMTGPEISAFYLCQEQDAVCLGEARDHKRLLTGDQGPNTGGMGTYSPVPDFTPTDREFVTTRIVKPLLLEMQKRGLGFHGFLFVGLMRTAAGLKVVEFNVRLGDPETQVLTHRWQGDLFEILRSAALGLPIPEMSLSPKAVVHVVMAAEGYPGVGGCEIQKNVPVPWDPFPGRGVVVYPSGINRQGDAWVNRSGRVLGITAPDLRTAISVAESQYFSGAQWRTDIGSQP